MIRGGIISLAVLFTLPFSVSADTIIYENDFSSDPEWVTDQPDNFYWSEASSSLSIKIENQPPDYAPNRYFSTLTTLDPNQDWKLEWDMYLEDATRTGLFTFGLYSPDYIFDNRTYRNTPRLISESTVNFSLRTFRNNYTGLGLNIVDNSGDDLGFGATLVSPFYDLGIWYTMVLEYDTSSGTLSMLLTERDTDVVAYEATKVFTEPVSFSDNMNLLGVSFYPGGTPGSLYSDPASINHYTQYQVDNVVLTQLEDEPEEPEEPEPEPLSELLLKYEPVLYFHEDEDYYPMNVEAFVEGSGLWDSTLIDENLIPRGEGNNLTLEYLATTTDTENWYINFSSDSAGDFDLAAAKARYDALRDSGKAVPTYYAYETEDSYTDEFGNQHDFIVLQYWYFYAMNNWGEQGGFNNHEGDWESVFVFLDKDTEEPIYAAFSAHHNDGFNEIGNVFEYDSVRREWDQVLLKGGQPSSYVAKGSHANYARSGNFTVPVGLVNFIDEAEGEGIMYAASAWQYRETLSSTFEYWNTQFRGKWGSNEFGLGTAGPRGPLFSNVSGINRFEYPIEWAGIDAVSTLKVAEPTKEVIAEEVGVHMAFRDYLQAGDTVSIAPYQEFISFGDNTEDFDFLPRFWDFTTSLPNESFSVEVTIEYSDEEVAALEIDENSLQAFFYNAATNLWEPVASTLDKVTNQITFETTHFSRYAIGAVPKEIVIEGAETKVNWGGGNKPQEGVRTARVSFTNTADEVLDGPLAIVVTPIDSDAVHAGVDGVSDFGEYQDVLPEEYGGPLLPGDESAQILVKFVLPTKKKKFEAKGFKINVDILK